MLDSHTRSSTRGMTLIELLVVITIIGLITAVATVRLTGLTGRARRQQAIEQMSFVDAGLRDRSSRFAEPSTMQLEMHSSTLRRESAGDEPQRDVVLAGDVRVTRFLSATREVSTGLVSVEFSSRGTSDTYAVELSAPGRKPQWLLFAGLTGQRTLLENEREVQDILEVSQPERPDAG